MSLELRQLDPLFAAEAAGIDLGRAIDPPTIDAIWRTIDEYAVLVFRDQRLDDAQLRDFAALFGPLEIGCAAANAKRRRLAHPEIGDISNLDEDGNLRAPDDRRRLDALGNRLWHIDASYMPVPVVLGMLHAVAVPAASAWAAARPNSPTCAPPMTRCRRRCKTRWKDSSRCTTSSGRAA
jgi:alpha-ketoglutarate-dependent 2,4-dichlorophenoxyacetate dioxygenase